MVDLRAALRPLLDEPPRAPRPVSEIAERARRRRARRRSAQAALVSVAVLATLVGLGSRLGEDGHDTEAGPPTNQQPTSPGDGSPAGTAPSTTSGPETTGRATTTPETTSPTTTNPTTTSPPPPPDPNPHLDQPTPAAPFAIFDAEAYDGGHGVAVTGTGDGGGGRGIIVGDGDYVMFDDVDLGTAIATGFDVRLASAAGPDAGGRVEVRMDGLDAPSFATVVVTGTGGRDTFEVRSAATPAMEGVHDFYVTFSSEQEGDLAVVDWFRFQS